MVSTWGRYLGKVRILDSNKLYNKNLNIRLRNSIYIEEYIDNFEKYAIFKSKSGPA